MALTTSKLIICVDVQRDSQTQTDQCARVQERRARVINPDTLAEVGASSWHPPEDASEREVIGYAVRDFYARGGFRSGVKVDGPRDNW